MANKTVLGRVTFGFLSTLALLPACGSAAERSDDGSTSAEPAAILEIKGRTYLRTDLWSPEDIARMDYEGRPHQPRGNAVVLAAQLRSQMRHGGASYVEMEPNIEMARRILAAEADGASFGTPQGLPREGRTIQAGGDFRSKTTLAGSAFPNTTLGFMEIGCTVGMIGAKTGYTAAHCLWSLNKDNWYCRDQSSVGSNCAEWPRYKFGVDGTTSLTGSWTANGCDHDYVPTAFKGLEETGDFAGQWTIARWDYAGIDFSACTIGSTSWLGTWIASDSDLSAILYVFGYPGRATCPVGADGTVGVRAANGSIVSGSTDCPGTGVWPGSTWRFSGGPNFGQNAPWTGAEIWGMNLSGNRKGDLEPASTIKLVASTTQGQSGAPIYLKLSANDRRVVGAVSWGGGNGNKANRFNVEVYNFLAARTPYPEDTQ